MKRTYFKIAALAVAAILSISILAGCTSGPSGIFGDERGAWRLELKSGGKATLNFQGQPLGECSYTSTDKQLTLTCPPPAGTSTFNIQSDGTLVGPPNSNLPTLKKK
jgi:hypothetical protein